MIRDRKLFLGSFFLSLLLIFSLCGFIVVDNSMRQYGGGETGSIMGLEVLDEDTAFLTLMGRQWTIGGEPLRKARQIAKEYAFLLPPRVRMTSILVSWGNVAFQDYREREAERAYRENVKLSERAAG